MTQEELAEAAGVSRASVQNIEQGRAFKRATPSLRAIAKALSWPYDRVAAVVEGRPETPDADPQAPSGGVPADEFTDVVASAMVAVADTMTASEIRDVSRRVTEELKRRGFFGVAAITGRS